jgi:MFS family permease
MGFALGTLHTATAIGQFMGPVFGGILSDFVGYRPIFFIVATVCALAAIAVFFFVHEVREDNAAAGAKPAPGFLDNYRFIAREPALRLLFPLIFITQLPVAVIRPIFALFAESFSLPPDRLGTFTGLAYGTLGFAVALSAPWWGRRIDRKRNPAALYLPIAGAGACYLLHMVVPTFGWIFPVRALLGVFLGGILPILYSLITSRVASERLGGIMGIASSMTILAAIAGPLAGGMIVANFGFRVAFAVAALLFFAALPLAWRATEAHGLAAAARAGGGGAGVDVVAAAAATAAGMGAPAGPAGDEGIAASTRKPSDPARAAS